LNSKLVELKQAVKVKNSSDTMKNINNNKKIIFADRRQSNQFDRKDKMSDADLLRIKKLNLKYAHSGWSEINHIKKQATSKMALSDQKPAYP
jgi:hypothetical protein